jgi:diguanylate cyclase (GGDEF)-like protein
MMARILATFYVFAGVAGLLAAGGAGAGTARWVISVFAGVGFVCAVIAFRWGPRWPRWFFHVPVASATGLVAGGVVIAPGPVTAVIGAALTAFAAIDAFLFFSLPQATLHLVFGIGGVTTALLLRGDVPVPSALALAVIVMAVGTVTRGLVIRASSASSDPLTGLANRRGFDDALQELMGTVVRTGEPLSAALLDLDFFKRINDTQGHEAGDQVLCRIADTWRCALPRTAVLARQGGDEFALLLPGLTGPDALALVRGIAASHPDTELSIGVAEHHIDQSGADLMRRADRALYDAKAAGRNQATLEGGPRSELAGELAAALDDGGIQVHYQPIVALPGAAVVGVEALARWHHPVRGPVGPAEFVPAAEDSGLVLALGEHVLRTACADMAGVRSAAGEQVTLGVNVSGRELSDPGYPDRVHAVLTATGFPADHLVLEVTESLIEGESPVAVAALHALRAAGMKVSIDDFGTGYSSLSRLDTLPADVLKLDRSFTATLSSSPRRQQMLISLVGMCAALGLDVVAEGVETVEQDAAVRAVGCTFVQGWLYGRATPLPELLAVLAPAAADVSGH